MAQRLLGDVTALSWPVSKEHILTEDLKSHKHSWGDDTGDLSLRICNVPIVMLNRLSALPCLILPGNHRLGILIIQYFVGQKTA